MLAHLALAVTAALTSPFASDREATARSVASAGVAAPATLPGAHRVDVGTALAGPLAPALAHLSPGRPGGTDVTLFNVNTKETLTVFLRFDGLTDEETSKALASFFRCKRTGRQRRMSTGTLAVFSQLTAHYPGRVIEVVSGVRAPGYGVRDSKHYSGHAIDFRVRGIKTKEVRDLAWAFDEEIGLGHYTSENFIHLDQRSGEGKIAWQQNRPGQGNRYNPRWAKQTPKSKAPVAPPTAADHDEAPEAPAAARPARALRSQRPQS